MNESPKSGSGKRLALALCLAVLMTVSGWPLAVHADERSAVESGQDSSVDHKVYMFSSSACIYCYVARKTFDRYGIDYEEFDISTSEAARNYFIRLGGRGTPLIVVNGKRMHGFNEERFWALYGERPEPVSLTDRNAGSDQPK